MTSPPDGTRHIWAGQTGKDTTVCVDGTCRPADFGYFHLSSFVFSPDSKHLIYAGKRSDDDRWHTIVVFDHREIGSFGAISRPIFSQDSRHYAFLATPDSEDSDSRMNLVIDGKLMNTNAVSLHSLRFSADSDSVSYVSVGPRDKEQEVTIPLP